jgi:hypothetical protein
MYVFFFHLDHSLFHSAYPFACHVVPAFWFQTSELHVDMIILINHVHGYATLSVLLPKHLSLMNGPFLP